MDYNHCARVVNVMHHNRQAFVIEVIKGLCLYDVERKEVQPFIDELKEKHKTCSYLAVDFFNGKNAELRYQQNFDKWWAAQQDFFKYIPEMYKALKVRFPDEVDDRMLNIDISDILSMKSNWGN